MKMHEKLMDMSGYTYLPEGYERPALTVYNRYVDFETERCDAPKPVSFVAFLFEDVEHRRLDAFEWPKGVLVKTKNGDIGVTTGWDVVETHSAITNSTTFTVKVRTAKGELGYLADGIAKAEIPPEVLEYVKSTLQVKVHDKVDEAFSGK